MKTLLAVLIPFLMLVSASTGADKPNILFVFADDMTFESIGAYGLTDCKTPNLDRLVERGATFTQAYNMGAWNGAVCIASRAMLNSGAFVNRAKAAIAERPHWSEMMKGAGYTTYMTGKWHVPGAPRFDVVKDPRPGMPKGSGYNRPKSREDYQNGWKPWDKSEGGFWQGGTHWSEVVANHSIDFLKRATEDDKPFFMYLAFNASHDPRQSPKEYIDMYPLDEIKVPENYLDLYPYRDAMGCGPGLRDEKLAPFPRTEFAVKVHRQEYFAIITHMDAQIGRIFEALEATGKADNTYIIFTADHGLACGHHGLLGKQSMYDHSMRVPFMIAGPGIKPGSKFDMPIYLQDAMATSLELARAKKPDYVEFKSLLPLIKGEEKVQYDSIYGKYIDLQRMIAKGDWKLIAYPAINKLRLYNTTKDPFEMQDQADNPKYSGKLKELKAELKELQKAMGDDLDIDHAATVAKKPDVPKRPNILFIFTDDHCEQAISAYGSKLINTPNMDRIADGGMRFNRCYVTNSICGPSRACIQTGKYSHVNGFMTNGNNFNGDQQTFPKLLRKAGYQTAIVGKWHLKSTPQGFDYYDVLIGQGPYNNPPMLSGGIDSGPTKSANPGYTTNVITDKTLAWLKNDRDPEKPFMLMFQHKAPHRNWMPDEKYQNWLDDVTLPEPETLWDDYQGRTAPASRQTMSIRRSLSVNDLKLNKDGKYAEKNAAFLKAKETMTEKEIVQWKYQRYVKDYLRCVRSVDDGIGRVLDYLDKSGLADNTIVIYSSDQGWYLGDHGWFDKRWMYEESLKTPLLVRWPGVTKPGSVNNDIVSNIDFAQTFLDLAGVKDPGDMHGYSLVPVLEGKTPSDWRKSFYYHYYEFPGAHAVARHYGVTTGHHKLIHFYGPSHVAGETYDEWELFDLKTDPNEMTNRYADPEYAEIRKKLLEELDRLRSELKVPEDTRPGRQPRPRKGKNPKA